MLPFNEWLTIVTYRDFHDVPRLILAADEHVQFWILDSQFDDGADDYSPQYAVYFAGRELDSAQLAFRRHAGSGAGIRESAASVSVKEVEFDQTCRRKLLLRSS